MIKIFANTKQGYLQQDLALQLLDESEFYWEVTATAKSLKQFPFYRLYLKDDEQTIRKYGGIEQMIYPLGHSYQKRLESAATFLAQRWQTLRIRVWENHLQNQDILWSGADILLISKRFKSLLEKHKLTGFTFEPCLMEGKEYSKEVEVFGGELNSAIEFADCFQLVPTTVSNPINMGAISEKEGKGIRCLVKDPYMPTSEYFTPENLKDSDVQAVNQIHGIDNHKNLEYCPDLIFSHRFLQLIIDHKLKGLRPFSSKPKIDYVVVPVRAEAYDDSIHKGHWDIDTIKQYLTK